VNYNSFLKKDYKNISQAKSKRKYQEWREPTRQFKAKHIIGIAGILLIIGSILISIPDQAEATRSTNLESQNDSINNQITIDLELFYEDKQQYIDTSDSASLTKTQIERNATKPDSILNIKDFTKKSTLSSKVPQLESADTNFKWTTIKVKSGDSLARIFKRSKLRPTELHDIMNLGKSTKLLKAIQPGQEIQIKTSTNGDLQELIYIQDSQNSLHVNKLNNSFTATPVVKIIEKRITHTKVIIHNSLFEAGLAAGLSNSIILDLAGIFGWDIDFALDIRSGDQFSIVYEEHYLEGKKIRDGAILVAEFINQKRQYQAIRFTDKQNRTDYYTPEGLSMRKAFLRTPVDFRRISSRFGQRKHPVLNYMRLHKGVDYAARRGTPVRASGDGKIIWKRRKGGYGRAIIIKHGGKYSTLYAHLNSYKKGLRVGQKIKQGQTIAYVGSSGRSTGPHLHYEFRVNGVHRNPLTVKLPNARPIRSKFKAEYLSYASKMIAQLDNYNQVKVATILNIQN